MAEAIWNHRLKAIGLPPSVSSAGLQARSGDPIHPSSAELLESAGISVPDQGSRPISSEIVRNHDLIIVMESFQKSEAEQRFPYLRGRVFTIGHWGGFEVQDPMGRSPEFFKGVYQHIDRGIGEWFQKLNPK